MNWNNLLINFIFRIQSAIGLFWCLPKWSLCHAELSCRIAYELVLLCRYFVCSLCLTRPIVVALVRRLPFCSQSSCCCSHDVLLLIYPDSESNALEKRLLLVRLDRFASLGWEMENCIFLRFKRTFGSMSFKFSPLLWSILRPRR